MTEIQEILISTGVGLSLIMGTVSIANNLPNKDHKLSIDEPVPITGFSKTTPPISQFNLGNANNFTERESHPVIVAVIDTGCDIHHPDLQNAIWQNPGETGLDDLGQDKASNGIDDDANGWVDDAHGWDFVSNSPALMDEHGHGTHVAGIVGAQDGANNPHVRLMILKYYDAEASGEENLERSIAAMHYAVQMGAQIINYSGGGFLRDAREEEVLRMANERGVMLVAAAGNEGQNSDFFPFYPADYDLPNILSVGATDEYGQMLLLSNYGHATVDVVARGKNVYSTLPRSSYGYMTGTSQAAAVVTRLVAELLISSTSNDLLEPRAILTRLEQRGRKMASLNHKVATQVFVQPESEDTLN